MSNDVEEKKSNGELAVFENISALPVVNKQYKGMLKHIKETMPAIQKSSSNFYKFKSVPLVFKFENIISPLSINEPSSLSNCS